MKFSIIAAGCPKNNKFGIGYKSQIPWSITEDMSFFKQTTLYNIMIMGRVTWESLPKPLPGRIHIVISNTPQPSTPTVYFANSVSSAFSMAIELSKILHNKIFVIGGGMIYAEFIQKHLDQCEYIYLTVIPGNYECDTYIEIPNLDYTSEYKTVFERNFGDVLDIEFRKYKCDPE